MMIVHTKTITILIAVVVFTAVLIMGFGGYVFAGKDYNSSISNSSSIGKIHEYVGNILLPYGVGGMEINRVNDAIDVGITEDALKVMLSEILGNVGSGATSGEGVSNKVQAILLEFDKLGISKEGAQAVSAPDAGDAVPSAAEGTIKDILPIKGISTPGTGDIPEPATVNPELHRPPTSATGKVIDVNPPKTREASTPDAGDTTPRGSGDPLKGLNVSCATKPEGCKKKSISVDDVSAFHNEQMNIIRNIKSAASEERKNLIGELRVNRKMFQTEIVAVNLIIRANTQDLRDNFRENARTTIGHLDHGKTGRIAVAHGKGLRMINRYRSAIARFDHILGRLESRIEKNRIETEAQARARGQIIIILPPPNLAILIEEAKNTQVENEAKLVELQAKYESLLTGENPQGERCINCGNPWLGDIAVSADTIAQELKVEIKNLHAKLREIAATVKGPFVKGRK